MQHVNRLQDLNVKQPSMLTIGVFDGVHRGHQFLIHALIEQAHERNLLAGVMTFHPHPDEVLRGKRGRYYLTTVEERAAYIDALGADYLITHPFNAEVMQIRAANFVDQLVRYTRFQCLWVGADFALGYRREGDIPFLMRYGSEKGFEVRAIELLNSQEDVIRSTTIRESLRQADLPTVHKLLGRAYSVTGEIIHGKKRGRQLGYPTANIAVPDIKLIPANGVYAGWATVDGERYMAAANVGYSSTFGNESVTVEAYLLDFDRDIYGKTMNLTFEKYLRPEMKFDGLEALIQQMAQDVEVGRQFLQRQQD